MKEAGGLDSRMSGQALRRERGYGSQCAVHPLIREVAVVFHMHDMWVFPHSDCGRSSLIQDKRTDIECCAGRSEDSHDSAEGGRSGNERNGSGDRKESFSGAAYSTRPARTPRQQEQNKMAQQRYRERRKMKVRTHSS